MGIRSKWLGLPKVLESKKEFSKGVQGTIIWTMHISRKMSVVFLMNKMPLLVYPHIKTHYLTRGESIDT